MRFRSHLMAQISELGVVRRNTSAPCKKVNCTVEALADIADTLLPVQKQTFFGHDFILVEH